MAEESEDLANAAAAAAQAALAGASRDKADAYLEQQIQLSRMQLEDMRRENRLRHWSFVVRHVGDVLKLAFELAFAFLILAVAVGVGATLWSAAHDNSLVIEAFSVPPDLGSRGMSGETVASALLDKLAALQDETDSARPADSYANNWGDDIKVQIPETGVSIGEVYRVLVRWLGNQTHITGEVYRTRTGLAIAVRASGHGGGAKVTGSENDLDALLQKAAEAIYARTQPYRYASFLQSHDRLAEGARIYRRLAVEGATAQERAWAYVGYGVHLTNVGDFPGAIAAERKAAAIIPNFALAYANLEAFESAYGHDEAALADAREAAKLFARGGVAMAPRARAVQFPLERANAALYAYDLDEARRNFARIVDLPDYSGLVEAARDNLGYVAALQHDFAQARRLFAALPATRDPNVLAGRAALRIDTAVRQGRWRETVAAGDEIERLTRAYDARIGYPGAHQDTMLRQAMPMVAYAFANLGDFRRAHAAIDRTAADCLLCLRMRGRIDALEKNWRGADAWFARAAAFAPHVSSSFVDWGETLLARGDAAGAIAKFVTAHGSSPRFADPLEGWGEALMKRNRSDLALAKFAEAAKYAPRWSRLHAKWGEALGYLGRKDEAAKQFALAREIDKETAP
ncbi:MAG: hypothetical protein JOZ72_14980 [Alphaproteobacteria bacterium]|nr:hypothetical protein [Alphaproteobacteria bacterium]